MKEIQKEIQKRFKFSGMIHDDDVLHSASLHAEQGKKSVSSYIVPAPSYIKVPKGPDVPQYAPTEVSRLTGYNPSGDCKGYFMSYRMQPNNNCYNYAINAATNSFAQPGRKSGNPLPPKWTAQDVVNGAVSDGLKLNPDGKTLEKLNNYVKSAEPGHFVALMISDPDPSVFWEGDYHWARLDGAPHTGLWSQKDGGDQVTNFDFAGNFIKDPRTANWEVNQGRIIPNRPNDVIVSYVFHTYMFVPYDRGLDII